MIVVDIELSGDTPTKVCDAVVEKFPFNSVDHRIERRYDDRYELYYVIIELAQSDLTPEQEQHLNRCEYVRKYDTRKGGLDGKVLTSMLTLLIQLKNASSWSKACQMVTENFPGEAVLSSADPNEGLRLKLNQVVLTDVQRDWMHLSAIGTWYIDEYQVIEPDNETAYDDIKDVLALQAENTRLLTVIESRDVAAQETVRHLQLENSTIRRELEMVAEDLREIVDIHGDHDMTSTPTEKLSRMASGIEGMFKKESANG